MPERWNVKKAFIETPYEPAISWTSSLGLYPLRSICRSPSVMSNNQNANSILLDTKEKIERKSVQIHSSEIAPSYIVFFRFAGRVLNKQSKFRIKVVGKMNAANPLVIIHDCINLRKYSRMEYNPQAHLR